METASARVQLRKVITITTPSPWRREQRWETGVRPAGTRGG